MFVEDISLDVINVDADKSMNDELFDGLSHEGLDWGNRIFDGGLLIAMEFEEVDNVDDDTLSAIAFSLNGHTPKNKK